jgi:hypothetical protein
VTALDAIGVTAAATKFSVMASLTNFPIWWMSLLLGRVADRHGAPRRCRKRKQF